MPKKPKPKKTKPTKKRNALGFISTMLVFLLLGAYAGVLEMSRPHVKGQRLRIDSFIDVANQGRIKDATILDADSYVIGHYTKENGDTGLYNAPYLKDMASRERLVDVLLDNQIPTTIDQQFTKSLVGPATLLLPALILVVIFIYLILSYRNGSGLFGIRSGARKVGAEDSTVRFSDVAGQESALTELREISQFLSNPDRFSELGAVIPKGILLYGPPGCGKTLVARALAGEAGASFYSISGSDFVELYVGVGASRVRELFKEARENAPSIVFIDELDSVGRRRGGGAGGAGMHGSAEEQEQALNQILAEMDGFSPTEGIIIIGATNRPDILDPALLRPGRFDRTVGLERPDEKGRLAILEVHARKKKLESGVDLRAIANKAVGMTGADLASVLNEAALLAARGGKKSISQEELRAALNRILEAPERQRRLSMRDRSVGQQSIGDERVTFKDVAGIDEAIEELSEVREYLDDPERFVNMGARPPRGFLLIGPPGCGKTLLARAVATESNAAFFSMAATEFTEIFVGEGAGRVRDLFAQARAVAPAIIFIDEIDAIGARRGVSIGGHRETEQTLNQILIELDGFGQRSGVIIMAASNRPEILDPALVRPGRFDRTITIGLPDRAGRRAIIDVHAAGKPLAPNVDLDAVAGLTQGLSGADLANVMNEAALLATRRRLPQVPMSVIEEAIDRVGLGISRAHILTEDERKMVAYHETGHGLVARGLPGGKIPHKLTIIPRGRALGATYSIESSERLIHSRAALVDEMAVALGGRVAEELVFGEAGTGAADDLARVSTIARRMVCDWGMSKLFGPITYSEETDADGRTSRYSEDTAHKIDLEVQALVHDAYELAREVLTASRAALDRVAQVLLEKETLTREEFEAAAGPPPEITRRVTGRKRAVAAAR